MTHLGVDALLAAGRLERVPADVPVARDRLATARVHIVAAEAIVAVDPDGSLSLTYDAVRKAVTAHMLAVGLRPRNRPGAHQAVVHYANSELAGADEAGVLRAMDRLRRLRNRSEYGSGAFTEAEARFAIGSAIRIVDLVAANFPVA